MSFKAMAMSSSVRLSHPLLLRQLGLWWVLVGLSALALVLVFLLRLRWLSGLLFGATSLGCVLHCLYFCLTRRISGSRLLVQLNLACLAAGAMMREELEPSTTAGLVLGAPLLSWYLLWGWKLIGAKPAAGEAMRPVKSLRECHPVNAGVAVMIVGIEFVQLNSLSFNPALGGAHSRDVGTTAGRQGSMTGRERRRGGGGGGERRAAGISTSAVFEAMLRGAQD